MGVPFRRFDALVADQPLYGIEIHAATDQPGGKGMPQVVEMQILKPGLFNSPLKGIFKRKHGDVKYLAGRSRVRIPFALEHCV